MKRALIFFVALVVVAGAIVGVVLAKTHKDEVTLPAREVDTFLHSWERNDAATMATLLDAPPTDLATYAGSLFVAVPGSTATYTRTSLTGTGSDATATYHAVVKLKNLGRIEWNGSLALAHTKQTGWLVKWSPGILYPGMRAGRRFVVKHTWPHRASIVAANGTVLAGPGAVTTDGALHNSIVGNVGAITAERLKQLGPPYAAGRDVGLSGLQYVYERQLAGTPRTDLVLVDRNGATVRTVRRVAGTAPTSVHITIDPAIQAAAETALAGETKNSALVAIDTTTGAVKAVVSKPYGGFNRALAGTYPPGSTFKVITSAALLAAGRNGATPAPCPKTLTVDGRTFKNFEGEAATALDLATAFAQSCNNAFIGLADQLPADALGKAAASFGFNTEWTLGLDHAGGSFPKPKDAADRAASAIGQGRVLASPLQMASVAAAVATGRWRAPLLVTEPRRPTPPAVPALNPVVVSTLQSFMASVVRTGGTAAGTGLPPDSFGKTGTAEFGSGNPVPTHAWFIGYRGNLAYAVIVEDGGVGGRVAAPLAAGFLAALPR